MRMLAVDRIYCGYPGGRPPWQWGNWRERVRKEEARSPVESEATLRALRFIARGAKTSDELAEAMSITRGAANAYAKRLEDGGFITRVNQSAATSAIHKPLVMKLTSTGRARITSK